MWVRCRENSPKNFNGIESLECDHKICFHTIINGVWACACACVCVCVCHQVLSGSSSHNKWDEILTWCNTRMLENIFIAIPFPRWYSIHYCILNTRASSSSIFIIEYHTFMQWLQDINNNARQFYGVSCSHCHFHSVCIVDVGFQVAYLL